MLNTIKILMTLLVFTLLISQPTPSYAWEHGHQGHSTGHGYHEHGFYHSHFGLGFNYAPIAYYDPYYYSSYYYPNYYTPGELVSPPVVETPEVVAQPSTTVVTTDTDDSFTINIPNSVGGYTSVVIKRSGDGFIGPQGEYYSVFPKISQLKVMYGIQKVTRN